MKRKALCGVAVREVISSLLHLWSVFPRILWLKRLIQLFLILQLPIGIILGLVEAVNVGGEWI